MCTGYAFPNPCISCVLSAYLPATLKQIGFSSWILGKNSAYPDCLYRGWPQRTAMTGDIRGCNLARSDIGALDTAWLGIAVGIAWPDIAEAA